MSPFKGLFLLLVGFLSFWAWGVVGAHANIQWSATAKQQVKDWANGGSGSWAHTIERGRGLPGPRR